MVVDKPTKNIDIAALDSAMNGPHYLILFTWNWKGCAEVHISRTIESSRSFKVALQQRSSEGTTDSAAASTHFDNCFVLEIISVRKHLGRPLGGQIFADADTTISALTRTLKHCKRILTDKAMVVFSE